MNACGACGKPIKYGKFCSFCKKQKGEQKVTRGACERCGQPGKGVEYKGESHVYCFDCYHTWKDKKDKIVRQPLTDEYLAKKYPISPDQRDQLNEYNKIQREYAIEAAQERRRKFLS